jgi:hypothetical protein
MSIPSADPAGLKGRKTDGHSVAARTVRSEVTGKPDVPGPANERVRVPPTVTSVEAAAKARVTVESVMDSSSDLVDVVGAASCEVDRGCTDKALLESSEKATGGSLLGRSL